jgi:hypothetical protein
VSGILSLRYKPEDRVRKIGVALPTHDMVPARFMYDLNRLTMHTIGQLGERDEYGVTMVKGTYVHAARQQLLKLLLTKNLTHILWLDTDMAFPRDALLRLLAHDLPVVGINYCQRGEPYEFVAIKEVSWAPDGKTKKLVTGARSAGVEEVEAVGFGMVLMKTDILACLPPLAEKPWFWFEWISGERQVGEDVYFCRILREAGHKIYVDHDLSKDCAHIGQHEFECLTAEAMGDPEIVAALAEQAV